VVVAPAYPHTHRGLRSIDVVDVLNQPGDASFVLSRVLTGRVLQAAVDPSRVAAAGHSAGGITTVGLFTSSRDARLVAGVVLAGSGLGVGTGFTGPPAWLLFVHGNVDPLVTYDGGRQAFQGDPWSKAFLTLPGQGHGLPYLDPGAASFAVVASTTTDFWRLALYGDRAAGARLSTDATSGAGHGAPGTLTSSLPG
jgi:poly(3-hydroxybutyrate) depolymerase